MFNLVVSDFFEIDTNNAFNYYESILIGLGVEFIIEVDKVLLKLQKDPQNYSYLIDDSKKLLRSTILERFPFVLIYEIINNDGHVYSLHNTHQNPNKKLRKK